MAIEYIHLHIHLRGSKAKKLAQYAELRKHPQWEDAHRYTTLERIEKGVIGRIGEVEYHL